MILKAFLLLAACSIGSCQFGRYQLPFYGVQPHSILQIGVYPERAQQKPQLNQQPTEENLDEARRTHHFRGPTKANLTPSRSSVENNNFQSESNGNPGVYNPQVTQNQQSIGSDNQRIDGPPYSNKPFNGNSRNPSKPTLSQGSSYNNQTPNDSNRPTPQESSINPGNFQEIFTPRPQGFITRRPSTNQGLNNGAPINQQEFNTGRPSNNYGTNNGGPTYPQGGFNPGPPSHVGLSNGNPSYQQGSNNRSPSTSQERPSESQENISQKPRDYKPITYFAWNLFKASNTPPNQNLVMCPLSPQLLLSYLAAGSSGATNEEIKKAIGYKNHRHVENLVKSMLTEGGNRELQFATAFFIADNVNLHRDFRTNDAIDVQKVDFTNPQQFQRQYNDWARSKTKGTLPQIQANPNPSTRMLLSSAVYFKGGWIYKFQPAQSGTFYGADQQPRQVPMMKLRKKLPYGPVGDMAEWVSLPYNSSDVMIIIKPKGQFSIEQVINNMRPTDVDEIMESLYRENYANVNLTMPKFKIDSFSNLVQPLQNMGIRKAFNRESEITKLSMGEPLQVSNAVQQASMEVNEEGSIASSLTSFSVIALSLTPIAPNVEFTVDRPFIAMIVNRDRKFPYFVAKICTP